MLQLKLPNLARRQVVQLLAASTAAAAISPALGRASTGGLNGEVRVPLDHLDPAAGELRLGYEWGAAHRPDRNTVLLVADAQQFYLRPGAAADLQSRLFGPDVNVLALFGRASSPVLKQRVGTGQGIDWARASRLLNVHQWIGDIRSAADALGIEPKRLGLYGRSGGADLVLRFIATHPQRAGRAYVQAAVTHDLAARWGVSADKFWEQLLASDPALARELAAFLGANPDLRREAILLLQRQNFYEGLDELPAARRKLVRELVGKDRAAILEYRRNYQLDAIEAMRSKGDDLSPVRLHEFSRAYPDPRGTDGPVRPDIESIYYYAEPVERSLYDAQVSRSYPSLDSARGASTEVLIMAGRHDHTSDYRTQIGLAGILPRSTLLLLDDDHVFKRLAASGRHPALLAGFFAGGLDAPSFGEAAAALAPLRWDENRR